MPIIKSAKKRVRVTARATERNKTTKSKLRDAVKAFTKALKGGSVASEIKAANSALDMAGKKNIMHKNKVARKKSQLAKAAKAANAAVTGASKAKASAKPAAKKPSPKAAVKKAPAKKAAPKAATVKK